MTTFTKRMAAMLMMLCLLVGLIIPAAATPSATPVVTTPTGYTTAEDVVYKTTNGIIANWGARGETSTFLTTYAEDFYTSGYTYKELSALSGGTTATAPSSTLYTKLQKLMVDNHTFLTEYSGSGKTDSRQLYKYTDCVSGDTSKVSLLYLGTLVNSTWDSGSAYNQEHVWPNSKCIGTDATDIGDIMHLRAADPTENSTRGNKAYGESSGYYDPGVSVRGDCARTLLYMYTRWGNTGKMWGTNGVIESLDILLKWIEEDPVDTWEMGHNDSVQSITGTRNVFVDYPELAFMLFNEPVPSMVTPSGNAGGHDHTYTTVVTAPTCQEQGYTTYTCTCGVRYVSDYTPVVDHNYVGGKCTTCGEAEDMGYTATLVTKVSDLRVGDQIVVVAKGYAVALSTTQNGNNRGQAAVTVSDDGTTVSFLAESGVQLITLENGTTTGSFALNVGNGYLYAASSGNNYLRTETKLSANSSWAISIADGTATMKAQGSNTRNLLNYNNTSKIFAAYGSAQKPVAIYVIDDGEDEVCYHKYSIVTVAATCTADGHATYTCDLCDDTYTEVIPATGHNYVGGKCTDCGEVKPTGNVWTKIALSDITAADVIAITMTKGTATWALYNGNGASSAPKAVVVTVNGSTMTSEDVDSIAWNIASDANGLIIYMNGTTSKWLYSTKDNNGTRVGTNTNKYWVLDQTSGYLKHVGTSRYLGVYNAQDWRSYTNTTGNTAGQTLSFWKLNPDTPAECDHSYTSSVTTEPTCTVDGVRTYTCTLCGDSYTEAVAATRHSYEGVVTAPTCTADGYTTYTCTVCSDSYVSNVVSSTGHTYESVVTAPTCTADGYTTHTCKVCGDIYESDVVATTGHAYEGIVTAPTCTSDGYTTYTCSACGHSYVGDIVRTTGHAYEGVVTAPTCQADGYTTYTCANCGDSYVGDKVTTSGHSYESVVTAPTCKSDGYTTHTCTVCGHHYVDSMVPTSGHNYESVVTAPTYNADGYTTHTCTACGHSYVDSIVPATGFMLAGANTKLGGVLDMNFFIDPADLTGTDYYAEITLYAQSGTVTTIVPYAQWETRSDYLVVTQSGLAARQMADKIEVVIYNGDGTQASFLWSDSIRSYVMRMLEKQDAEGKTMMVDMLNYGAAAQNYFNYNTGDLANSQLTDAQKAYATETVSCTDQSVKGPNYYGSSLVLKDRILMTVYFSNITPDMYAVVSFTDHKGAAHETRVVGSNFKENTSTVYGVVIDDLVVADGDQMVTVTVYDAEGNAVASASDSVNSYAARQMGKNVLYEMVAKFTTSAYAYLH